MNALAQKIREGAEITLPLKGALSRRYSNGLHACALGCVAIACGLDLKDEALIRQIGRCTGIDMNQPVRHPVSNLMWTLVSTITRLNDRDGWSREQIADWVDSLELDING